MIALAVDLAQRVPRGDAAAAAAPGAAASVFSCFTQKVINIRLMVLSSPIEEGPNGNNTRLSQ